MKNYILHGEDTAGSRQKLSQLLEAARAQNQEIYLVSDPATSLSKLLTLSRSQSLFGKEGVLLLENFLTQNPKGVTIAVDLAKTAGVNLIFWEQKKLAAGKLGKLTKFFQILEFKVPSFVFEFLDSLAPQNAAKILRPFHQALQKSEAEFLLLMLSRHLRLLIWARAEPQTLDLPSWRKTKLVRQAERFSLDELLWLHGQLLELDRQNKHSELPATLASSLDLLLAQV